MKAQAWVWIAASGGLFVNTGHAQVAAPGEHDERLPSAPLVQTSHDWCGTDCDPYSPRAALGGGTWTSGQVFYRFDPAASPPINATEQQNLLDAWARISAVCNVTFVPRVAQANYITISRNTSSPNVSFSSSIGMAGGEQFLRIGNNHWVLSGLLIHETMHALGFFHEQQRSDRNTFITVNTGSIDPGFIGNYNIATATLVGNYDFDSLMHYQLDAFVLSGVAMVVNWPYTREWQWKIGRYLIAGEGPSQMDRVGLVSRYGGSAPPRSVLLNTPTFGQRVGTSWNRTINWFASIGATSYRIMMDDDPYFRSPLFNQSQASTQYIHPTSPLPDTLYYIRLTATNAVATTQNAPISTYMIYTGDTWPTTVYVDASAPAGGNGRSWATAMSDLRIAVDLAYAANGQVTEIRVAQGTYRPDVGSADRTATFFLPRSCAIKGGYAGRNAPNPDLRDPEANSTILTGDLLGNDGPNFANIADNSLHVVTGDSSNAATRLDGFIIRGGNANGTFFADVVGAGVLMAAGSCTIANCVLEGHSAQYAAAILADDGSPKIVQSTLQRNRSSSNVGAAYTFGGSPYFANISFLDNTGVYGGGSFSHGGSSTYVNCLFARNAVTGAGGGLGFQSNTATVSNVTIASNSAVDNGGGLTIFGGSVLLRNSVIDGNTCAVGPQIANGGYGFTGGSLTVTNTLARGGQAAVFVGPSNTLSWGSGNLNADPRFLDAGNGDFSLRSDSPCIDVGSNALLGPDRADLDSDANTTEGIPFDLVGNPRVVMTTVDMGALEWQIPPCVADVDDGSGTGTPDGGVTIDDLLYYLRIFEEGAITADVDDGSGTGTPDGGITIDDLLYFLQRFEAGC